MISTLFVTLFSTDDSRRDVRTSACTSCRPATAPRIWCPRQMPKIGVLPISFRTCAVLKFERLGIAGAVREKNAVRLQRQNILGGRQRGNHRHARAGLHQLPQNIALDAEVVRDHVIQRIAGMRDPLGRATPARRPRATYTISRSKRESPDRARSSTGLLGPSPPDRLRARPASRTGLRASRRACAGAAPASAYRYR